MVCWHEGESGPRLDRIILPRQREPFEEEFPEKYNVLLQSVPPAVAGLCDLLARFLEGEAVVFPLDRVALELCPEFRRKVLLAEYRIPRGWVSSYGRIAAHLGLPRAARAVGRALAGNPFPIVIPCHRAVASTGRLGGDQNGPAMKRALLEMEGVEFSPTGRVATDRFFY